MEFRSKFHRKTQVKTPSAFAVIALVSVAAFLIGSWTSRRGDGRQAGRLEINTRTYSARTLDQTPATSLSDPLSRRKSSSQTLSTEKAELLSPEQRVALMKRAAVLADPGRQAEVLCGLISAMTPDELTETTKVLLDAQRRGNGWSQAVWNSLWTRWGNVDPAACLALSRAGRGLNTSEDYRYLMSGWLDTDPKAALAWATQPGHDPQTAAAAAFAIIRSAKGDLKQMESAILAISGNEVTAKACLHDYFDLAISSDHPQTPAAMYDEIAPSLRAAAWPVVLERLTYTAPKEAAAWLGKHAADPGGDYQATRRLVTGMSQKDPLGTAEWAVALPFSDSNNLETLKQHPAVIAINDWMEHDPAAAIKWLGTQPTNSAWLPRIRSQLQVIPTQ